MPNFVKVVHTGKGGSLTYRRNGRPLTITAHDGIVYEMREELYKQHQDKLILEEDMEFLKVSPDYKGEPKPFNTPRKMNPLAERSIDLVEKNQKQIDDGADALKAQLKELESEWVGRSTPEMYLKRYGKDNKKSALAAEIIRLKGLLAEVGE